MDWQSIILLMAAKAMGGSGGGGTGGAKVAIGTYTAASEISSDDITIRHNLGVIPNRLLFMLTDNAGVLAGYRPVPFFYIDEEQCLLCSKPSSNVNLSSLEYRILEDTISQITKDDSTIKLGNKTTVWHGNILAGWTILWMVMG